MTTYLLVGLLAALAGLAAGLLLSPRLRRPDVPALAPVVAPLQDALSRVERLVHDGEVERAEAHGELRSHLAAMNQTQSELGRQTTALVSALRASHVRGRWGEVQLRRIVEAAGMLEHCDFVEQATTSTDDGVLRPDLLVRLGAGRTVVVDAKVPFTGFIEAVESPDEATRRSLLRRHSRQVRAHVDALAAKDYAGRVGSGPDFVVMFLPSDGFLHHAVEVDPALLEYAVERDVVLATPATLLALLRTVAWSWRQDRLAAGARQVLDLGRELSGRIGALSAHLERLGASLGGAVTRFNDVVGCYEGRVAVTARRFAALGGVPDGLAPVAGLDRVVRPVRVETEPDGEEIDDLTDPAYGVRPPRVDPEEEGGTPARAG